MHESGAIQRILGLDVGLRRIGLAVSDELGFTAQGLETFKRKNVREDIGRLARLISELNISRVVVGNPLHMSGAESRQATIVKDFANRLQERTGVPVTFWDERLTTVEAQRVLRSGGRIVDRQSGAADRLSAVLILQSYLDSISNQV